MKYFVLLLLFLFSFNVYADIYKTVDANGNVTFSDKPISNQSTEVAIPKTNSSPATPPPPQNKVVTTEEEPATPDDQNTKKPYTKFAISSPADQDSIQNQPILHVTLDVQPELADGDVIQVYVDGGPMGDAKHQTSFDFTIPYRGTHILSAILFDKDMRVLKKATPITIFVHQAHIGTPAS